MNHTFQITNALIWDGKRAIERDLNVENGRIVQKPRHDALVIDLADHTIFPGLVNAHDHLELNHYPRTKFREVYNNAHEWGEDVNLRLNNEPFKTLRSYPRWDRLFIGGLKNLLCGATTVVHHGPPHKEIYRRDFPVRVLKNYGWAHSLHFNTDAEVVASYRETPKNWPWFIHLAEGTDEVAVLEYKRLRDLGCLGSNTVIVHGVGISFEDAAATHTYDFEHIRPGLIWCPSTNFYLLNGTVMVDQWDVVNARNIALGSDSRLTADGDLLDELSFATRRLQMNFESLLELAIGSYSPFALNNVGGLAPDYVADFTIWDERLLTILQNRSNPEGSLRSLVKLIVKGGIPQIGDPHLMAKFPYVETVATKLDGVEKAIHIDLARRIMKCQLKEPGLEILEIPDNKKQFWIF